MNLRTDIAYERQESVYKNNVEGVAVKRWTEEETEVTLTEI